MTAETKEAPKQTKGEKEIEFEKKFFKERRLPCIGISAGTLFIGSAFGFASMPMGAYFAPVSFIIGGLFTGGIFSACAAFADIFAIWFAPAQLLTEAYAEAKPWERCLPISIYLILYKQRQADKQLQEAAEQAKTSN